MDWQPILDEVQKALLVIVTMLLGWVVALVGRWVNQHGKAAQLDNAMKHAGMFVDAAEQIYGDGQGSSKMRWVKLKAAETGMRLTPAQIEAAVKRLNNTDAGSAPAK